MPFQLLVGALPALPESGSLPPFPAVVALLARFFRRGSVTASSGFLRPPFGTLRAPLRREDTVDFFLRFRLEDDMPGTPDNKPGGAINFFQRKMVANETPVRYAVCRTMSVYEADGHSSLSVA